MGNRAYFDYLLNRINPFKKVQPAEGRDRWIRTQILR
jgi:hypothetical protein